MNCAQTREYLYDYMDGELAPTQKQVFTAHIASCEHCESLLQQQIKLKSQIQSLPVVEPSLDFEQRIMDKLEIVKDLETSSDRNRKNVIPGFITQSWFAAAMGGALAAFSTVVMLWFIAFDEHSVTPDSSTLSVVSIELVPNQLQKVNLAFSSPQEIKKATFKIILPENVEIKGYKGKRELQWASKLKQGTNRLALPLVATKSFINTKGDRYITARITHEGKSRDFKIKVISKAQQSSIQKDVIPVFGIT